MTGCLDRVNLEMVFKYLDEDGDGIVSIDELQKLLQGINICTSRDELELLEGRERLNYVDFVLFYDTMIEEEDTLKKETYKRDETEIRDLRKAFEVFDLDEDGFISCEDLQIALSRLGLWDNESCYAKDCRPMIDVYDANSDGLLDFEEFKNMMMMMPTK